MAQYQERAGLVHWNVSGKACIITKNERGEALAKCVWRLGLLDVSISFKSAHSLISKAGPTGHVQESAPFKMHRRWEGTT